MVDPNPENHNAQPILFLGTQTENLEYMYSLAQKFTTQLAQNQHRRSLITNEIDILARRVNKSSSNDDLTDLNMTRQFLKQRQIPCSVNPDNVTDTLRSQNKLLKELLQSRQNINRSAILDLRQHDDGLQTVISLLRNDLYNKHVTSIRRLRTLFNDRLVPMEDKQFASYLESINDLQLLLELCELYRTILKLHP